MWTNSTIDEVQGINNCDNEEEKKDCPTTDDVSVSRFHKQHSQKDPKNCLNEGFS